MSDDFSLLRFDIDGDAMRTLLEALGVPPAAFEDRDTAPVAADDGASTGSTPPSRERTGPRVGETPPPGAGEQAPPAPEDGGRRRLLLLVAGGTTLLGALAGLGAVLYRRRSADDELPIPDFGGLTSRFGSDDEPSVTAPSDTVPESGPGQTLEPTTKPDRTGPETAADRTESTVDVAPFVGMVALAVSAVVVRLVRSGDDATNA